MRKKYTDETYLKGVTKCQIITKKLKKQNAYIVLKKIEKIDKPFVKESTLIDNGYYVLEYTPMDKNYNARAFIDKDLNTISYYFDITLSNGVDEGRPYYDDLFLDIIYRKDADPAMRIVDEDELAEALEDGTIKQNDYDLAHNVCDNLSEEIQNNKNVFINVDKKRIIKEIELQDKKNGFER